MNKKYLVTLLIICLMAALVLAVELSNGKNKDCNLIDDQTSKDGCYHTLAHKTGNMTFCTKIIGSGEREHCLGAVTK